MKYYNEFQRTIAFGVSSLAKRNYFPGFDLSGFTFPSYNCPGCINGVLDAGEQCDDGNSVSGDGCSPTCVLDGTVPCV